MIVTEEYMTRKDGVKLVRTYSDAGFTIMNTSNMKEYDEAIDVMGLYTYVETENPRKVKE